MPHKCPGTSHPDVSLDVRRQRTRPGNGGTNSNGNAGVADGRDIVEAFDRFAQSGEEAGLQAPELQQMMGLEAWLSEHGAFHVFAGPCGTWVAEPAAG